MIGAGIHGSIINIISTAGHQGEPGNIAYGTAKGGLLNVTRSVAMELAAHGIRVNSITPTATDPAESFERAQRWGRAEAPGRRPVARDVAFLRHLAVRCLRMRFEPPAHLDAALIVFRWKIEIHGSSPNLAGVCDGGALSAQRSAHGAAFAQSSNVVQPKSSLGQDLVTLLAKPGRARLQVQRRAAEFRERGESL